MPAVIYGLKNCDTCRKALKALPEATLMDVRADGMPEGLLERALEQFGQALLNTRSATWRGLSEDERKGQPEALIRAHPALMKRPLIAVDNSLFLSWNSEVERGVKALL
jgi:arsenate reductase